MNVSKVAVIGAGHVGATCAHRLLQSGTCEVVLLDIVEGLAEGKALDLAQASSLDGYEPKIKGTTDYKDIRNSDVVVVTAGLARKPGQSRFDLLKKNAEIVRSVVENIKSNAPDSIILMVTNPLDLMTHLAYKVSGFDKRRVLGMAGVLDTARLKYLVAKELNVSIKEIDCLVLGGHGDTMVPLPRLSTASGKPLIKLLTPDKIDELIQKTRTGGAEIVALLKTGSAYYAPGSSAASMVISILNDEKRIVPASVLLEGEYGIRDIFCGVPVKLGRSGVEGIVELDLTEDEKEALLASAEKIEQELKSLEGLLE